MFQYGTNHWSLGHQKGIIQCWVSSLYSSFPVAVISWPQSGHSQINPFKPSTSTTLELISCRLLLLMKEMDHLVGDALFYQVSQYFGRLNKQLGYFILEVRVTLTELPAFLEKQRYLIAES